MTDRFQPPGWAYWLAGILLFYAAVFLGFAATGAGIVASAANLLVQSVLWLASAALAIWLARRAAGPSRRLMALLAAVCMAKGASDGTWNLQEMGLLAKPASRLHELVTSCGVWLSLERSGLAFEVLYNLGWILFLGALAVEVYARWRPTGPAVVTTAILIPVVVGIFALVYLPAIQASPAYSSADLSVACAAAEGSAAAEAVDRNLSFVSVGVQALGVASAIAVSMAPLLSLYRRLVAAYLLLVATDFVMWTKLDLGASEGFYWNLIWTAAIALIYATLETARRAAGTGDTLDRPLLAAPGPNSSRLAGPATFLAVVPVAVTILLGVMLRADVDYLVAVSFLLLTLVLVLVASASSRSEHAFDRFVDTLVGRISHQPVDPPSGGDRLFYEITNLDHTARLIDRRLDDGLDRLLPVGRDGRFDLTAPAAEPGAAPSCFVIMPFGPPWADAVYTAIRRTVEGRGYRCVRGDDFFGANEIMDDVWAQMRAASILVADLTGRNPNVFYEVGMAHTLGLPILLLSQTVDDIPFDLASRRVIQYDPTAGTELLERAIALALVEIEHG